MKVEPQHFILALSAAFLWLFCGSKADGATNDVQLNLLRGKVFYQTGGSPWTPLIEPLSTNGTVYVKSTEAGIADFQLLANGQPVGVRLGTDSIVRCYAEIKEHPGRETNWVTAMILSKGEAHIAAEISNTNNLVQIGTVPWAISTKAKGAYKLYFNKEGCLIVGSKSQNISMAHLKLKQPLKPIIMAAGEMYLCSDEQVKKAPDSALIKVGANCDELAKLIEGK